MRILILFLSFLAFSCKKQNDLNQMLIDRPEMVCEFQDSLLLIATEKGVKWSSDSHPISSGTDFYKGIQLKKGMKTEEAWSSLFFEAYNLQAKNDFLKIYRKALDKGIDRYTWVEENAKLEYKNAQAFNQFAIDTLRPFYIQHGMETNEVDKMIEFFSKPFSDWMNSPESAYPWNYWGVYYDTYLVDRRHI